MLSVAEALEQVLQHAKPLPPTETALTNATGLVLAEDVASDVDSPPHDKSIVDGYAVRGADLKEGRAELAVLEEIVAGAVPTRAVTPGHASRIMTGAPMPDGADSIVMVERTEFSPGPQAGSSLGTVRIQDDRFRPGQNLMRRAVSLRKGDVVLKSGAELGPAEVGLLAEVGRARVRAIGPVLVAILSTGNELVPAHEIPGPGQIRNSNGPLLTSACRRAGAVPIDLGIGRDDAEQLRRLITAALECDIVVISGGVSAGVLDLVPGVLAELGVRQVFHKINLKPGKPLWFGVHNSPDKSSLIFALPGNPVSSLVCFELFVKPAIARLGGKHWEPPHPTRQAKLTREFTHRGDRPTYYPSIFNQSSDGPRIEPTAWQGSADLRGLIGANALALFPAGDHSYQAGDTIEVIML